MATHSNIFAWEILWTQEPGRLQFMGLQRVGHDLKTKQQQQCTLFQEVTGVNQLRKTWSWQWRIQQRRQVKAFLKWDWREVLGQQACSQAGKQPVQIRAQADSSRRRRWHLTPVLLPGKSYGWKNLIGCSPWGRQESDATERLHFHFSFSCIGEGNGNPLQCSCLENPRDEGAWWAAVCGVAQSWT